MYVLPYVSKVYGALTGLSKSMIKELYGDKQFKQWRRSYITRPPPTSSFSSVYPGNEVSNRHYPHTYIHTY